MRKLKCMVVDDEHLAQILLEEYIRRMPQLEWVGSCASSREAASLMETQEVDLLFLDIQMPDMRGTDFVRTLNAPPMVVFTTAYPQYAVESYRLTALDYLLKPIEFERFVQAVHKAVEMFQLRNNPMVRSGKEDAHANYFLVKADYAIHKIFYRDILYFEGLQEYVAIFLQEGRKLVSLLALSRLEDSLPAQFVRIHRSYIVNIDRVNALSGNQVVIGKVNIPIGKSYKEQALRLIFGENERFNG